MQRVFERNGGVTNIQDVQYRDTRVHQRAGLLSHLALNFRLCIIFAFTQHCEGAKALH